MTSIDYFEKIRQKLKNIEKESNELQKQGNYFESLEKLDEALHLSKDNFGEDSEEFQQCANRQCETCNLIAMVFQQKENFDACFDFLRKADLLAQNEYFFKALTFNNIACFYKTVGKQRVALYYLNQAQEIENRLNNEKNNNQQNIADIHQNICAVLSQLNKHNDAQVHAMNSIILIQDEMLKEAQPLLKIKKEEDRKAGIEQAKEESTPTSLAKNKQNSLDERITIQSIAYHNLAVELEYLHKYNDCLKVYNKAYEFSRDHLGADNQVSKNLQNVMNSATNQIKNKKKKTGGVVEKKKTVDTQNKMKKDYMLKNHAYSDKKNPIDKKLRATNTQQKGKAETGKAGTNTMRQTNKQGEGLDDKFTNLDLKQADKEEIEKLSQHNKADGKNITKEYHPGGKPQLQNREDFDKGDQGGNNWENMVTSREQSKENVDSKENRKNDLNPYPSDDEEEESEPG